MSAPVTLVLRSSLGELVCARSLGLPGEPAWLGDIRRDAAEWVSDHGFPTRKDEDWRYFDLRPLLELPFAPPLVSGDDTAAGALGGLFGPHLGGPRLVLVNGRFAPQLSSVADLPPGVQVRSLASSVCGGADSQVWSRPAGGWRHGFEALNAALAVDGGFVEVADRVSFEGPIEIVHVALGGDDPPICNSRTIVRIGAGAAATMVETYLGAVGGPSLTNAHTEITLGQGATVDHYRFQAETDQAHHLSTVEAHLGRDATFTSHLVAVGARLARHEMQVLLGEEGARVELDGLYITRDEQCHDNPVRVEHIAPGCTSRQVYRGIVDDAGHGIFNGHVIVHPGATGTDAQQVNKNLLLSDRAEVDTRPRLEIFADDVACTHGAAVGQLDPDALFYLRSRGIPEPDSRRLLVAGFAQEILERIPPGTVRDRADALVATQLQHGGSR